jgi:hypothetical protein
MRYQIGAPGQKGPSALPFSASGEAKPQGPIARVRPDHANIAMTLDLWSHVMADIQRQAVEVLEAATSGAEERTA